MAGCHAAKFMDRVPAGPIFSPPKTEEALEWRL